MTEKKTMTQKAGLALGPLLFLLVIIFSPISENVNANMMAATAVLMAVWWMTEAIPLAATALLPVVLFPILGIMPGKETAPVYFNSTIFLFLGGFLIAIAMEKWELHKRVSLVIIKAIGGGSSRLILGFMIASAFLSMFISNTATAIMMLPIGMAVISKIEESYPGSMPGNFPVSLMLGIAYAASIGGIATLVGTPPNLAFEHIFEITFPGGPEISFGQWMAFALPLSLIMLAVTWLLLTKMIFRTGKGVRVGKAMINEEYAKLGKTGFEERLVLIVFIATGLLWIFRTNINLGFAEIPGWSGLLANPKMIDDGTVAVVMASLLFILPASRNSDKAALLGMEDFKKVPWNIIILFGGGFALAKGFQESGLSVIVGHQFAGLEGVPPILIIALICLSITFLTELTSNTATTQTLLPILASISVALEINPLLLMVPATISASFAFMLPVATPPNAIVFGSGRVKIGQMVKAGLALNLVGVIVITLMFYLLGTVILGIDVSAFPDWAGK